MKSLEGRLLAFAESYQFPRNLLYPLKTQFFEVRLHPHQGLDSKVFRIPDKTSWCMPVSLSLKPCRNYIHRTTISIPQWLSTDQNSDTLHKIGCQAHYKIIQSSWGLILWRLRMNYSRQTTINSWYRCLILELPALQSSKILSRFNLFSS